MTAWEDMYHDFTDDGHDERNCRRCAGRLASEAATPPLVAASPVPPVVPDSEALGHCSTCNDTGTVVVYEGSNDVSFTYDLPCTDCDEGSGVVPDKPALAEAVRDVLWRAQRFGETDDGDTAHYIVTKGAMHRLMGAAQAAGIPASFRNDDSIEVPDKPALAPATACSTCNGTGTVVVYEGSNDVGHTYDLPCTDCAASVPAVTDDEAATKVIYDALDDEHADYYTPLDDVAVRLVQRLRSAGFLIVHPMQRGPEDPTFVMPDITAVHHTKET